MSGVAYARVEELILYMEQWGFTQSQLLKQAGLRVQDLQSYADSGSAPSAVFAQLCHAAKTLVPVSFRASLWAGGFASDSFRLMTHTVISARDLGTALARAADFYTLIKPAYARMTVQRDPGEVKLCYLPPELPELEAVLPRPVEKGYLEALTITSGLILWYQLLCWLIGCRIDLRRISTGPRAVSERLVDRLNQITGIRSVEQHDSDAFFTFPARYLDFPIAQTPEALERVFERNPPDLTFVHPEQQTVEEEIRRLLGERPFAEFPRFEEIAGRLNLSASGLRRRLLKESTSYQEVKNTLRKEMAISLLKQPQLPLSHIAERTGFSGQSAFSRMFYRWTGLKPQAYRQIVTNGD